MNYRFLLTRQWVGMLLLASLFAAGCVGLGNWQMDRRNQAVAEIRRVEQNYDASPVPFEAARKVFEASIPELKWATVAVSGQYVVEDQRIVRNRPNNSAPGYEVLVPFRLTSGGTIVINRGWLPIGNNKPGYPDAVPEPPAGNVSAVVRIKPSEPQLAKRSAPDGQLASIDLAAYAQELGYPLLTGSYGLMAAESPQPATAPQQLARPSVQEGSNLSYAMQWITFGVLAFVGFGYTARQQARIQREEHQDSQSATSPPPRRPGRSAMSRSPDEEEEDALLDAVGL